MTTADTTQGRFHDLASALTRDALEALLKCLDADVAIAHDPELVEMRESVLVALSEHDAREGGYDD